MILGAMKLVKTYDYKPWKTPGGKTVIDELCKCGALKSYHQRRFNHESSNGHGACEWSNCSQFTWERFVYAKEER